MAPFDAGIPALLLRLDDNPFHHGTLGAVRSLGRAGVEVHAFVESAHTPVGRSRYLYRAHRHPPGTPGAPGPVGTEGPHGLDRLAGTLEQVAERIGRPAVLIPMDDLSAVRVSELGGRLDGRFLLPAQPDGLATGLADKAQLARLCHRLDIPHPRTVVPGSATEATAAARELGLPLIAKWSRPWLLPAADGLRSTTPLHTPEAAGRLYARSRQAGSSLLLQSRVPGGRGSDWFFHGCFGGGDAGCLLGGAGRKESSWPVGAGLTAVGRWLPNPAVENAARRLAATVGYRGILDLDFRRDPSTGDYHLLDVNPRPGAQFRLFTERSGLDVVRALYLDLTGRTVPAPEPVHGRVFLAENYALLSWLVTAVAARADGAERSWRTGGGIRGAEKAWFAADDPAPFLAMSAAWCGRGMRKALRRAAAAAATGRPVTRSPRPVSSSAAPGRNPACPPAGRGPGPSTARSGPPGSEGC